MAGLHEQPGFGALSSRGQRAGPVEFHREYGKPDSGPHRGSRAGGQPDQNRGAARAEDGRRTADRSVQLPAAGRRLRDLRFDNKFTANNPFSPAGGYGYASYLLGTGASGSITTSQPTSGQQIYRALYFQDDWRVSRKLTLNLGVRWDLAGPWSERYNRLSVFLPERGQPAGAAGEASACRGNSRWWIRRTIRAAPTCRSSKKLFAPRVGLAYQLTPKTVLRAGYGIFYIPNQLTVGIDPHSDVVNSNANTWVPTIDNITPFTLFNNPFPNGLQQPAGRDPNFEQRLWGASPATLLPNTGFGYMQQWNFNIQRELPFGIFVDAAYAGAKGTHLLVRATSSINCRTSTWRSDSSSRGRWRIRSSAQ